MIRIKFEVEEQEEIPLSSKFYGKNENNVGGFSNDNTNSNNVSGTLKLPQKLPEKNVVVAISKKKLKPKQLDNSTTDFVVAVGSKSIKTEPVESSLSLTTQLNNSLNIQSLLRQNRIQNGWTTNEQSIPIGTQQQQKQLSVFSTKIEPIVPENHQQVPELSLDQSCSLNLNSNSGETTTNCDTTIKKIFGPRACLCRRTELNACYVVPKKQKQFTTTTIQNNSDVGNLELTNNDDNCNNSDQHSGSGSIFGLDPSASALLLSSTAAPGPVQPEAAAVPLLEEKKPVETETRTEKQRRKSEYDRKYREQQLLDCATLEQREQTRLKRSESYRRQMEKESEEQRQRRLDRQRQYDRTVGKQRRKQKRQTMTEEERETRNTLRAIYRKKCRNRKLNDGRRV